LSMFLIHLDEEKSIGKYQTLETIEDIPIVSFLLLQIFEPS
jgi:hypothetical protein